MAELRICSPQLGISPDSSLGGEVYDRELLKAVADHGVQVYIILPLGKKYERHKNWHVYFLPVSFIWPPYIFNLLILPYLFWIYFRHGFNVLRVHSPYFVGIGAIVFKNFFPKVRVSASYLHLEKKNKIYMWLDRCLIPKFDQITAMSNSTAQDLVQTFGARQDIVIIPGAVSEEYRPLPRDNDLINKYRLSGKKILLYVGQLIPRKNVSFLFEVLPLLPESYVLLIAGTGMLQDELEQKIRDKRINDRVIFLGHQTTQKIKFYNLADVFVFPSLHEGFGLVIIEAMACGNVIVASDLPVFRQIVTTGKNGFLLPLEPEVWAKSILLLESNAAKRKSISHGAINEASKYSWERVALKYREILKDTRRTNSRHFSS